MKVSILTFSLTGNTKLVAKRIGQKLGESEKNTVLFFNHVKIGKEIDAVGADKSHLLAGLRSSIESSDVIGLGAFSNFAHPSWRVKEIFTEEILPCQCFRSMKFFFTFSTAGQIIARTINVLSALLPNKNRSAVFLGSFSAISPENSPEFLPLKPSRDTWRVSELVRIETFGDQLVKYVDGLERIPPVTFKRVLSLEWAVRPGSRFRRLDIAKPFFVREKCQHCGTCEKKYAYNAGALKADIEDGFRVIVPAKCEGCVRCFNLCPVSLRRFSDGSHANKLDIFLSEG
jgi:Pyruvate/2-oxoacid:ferredoxin oxidoreductase delta subunit